MKVLHISYAYQRGGAAIACRQLHLALKAHGIESEVWTCDKECFESHHRPLQKCRHFLAFLLKTFSVFFVRFFQKSTNPNVHTFDVFSTLSVSEINASNADIVHLHWVNFCALSIKDVAKINKPVVWTLHDLWYALGTEHHDNKTNPNRFVEGYTKKNKDVSGLDVNRIAWELKKNYWKHFTPHIITPSRWLLKEVKRSALYREEEVTVVPNIVSLNDNLGMTGSVLSKLPTGKPKVLIGAYDLNDTIKGGHFVQELMALNEASRFEFILFGKVNDELTAVSNVTQLGYITSREEIAEIYRSCECLLLPSMFENLPNIALEALRMNLPIVAFDVGGVSDIVVHEKTGYLARPFEVSDLFIGLQYVLREDRRLQLAENCSTHFESEFSETRIIEAIKRIYKHELKRNE